MISIRIGVRVRALVAACLVLGAALASGYVAHADDLDSLRSRAQEFADEISALEHRLISLEGQEAELGERIARATGEISALEVEIHDAEAAWSAARARYVDSAVATYKAGPGSQLALLLSAHTVSELASASQAAGQIAQLDSEALAAYESARDRAEAAQAQLDAKKQVLLAAATRVDEVSADIEVTIAERSGALEQLNAEVAKLEREARREARLAAAQERSAATTAAAQDTLADVLSGAGAGPPGPVPGLPVGFASTGVTFEGIASWYGPGFEGNLTANGEIFDPSKFTAASKELPFGTWLYVEFQGRGVIVRINDRGPYADGRVIDLSQAAAEAIGMSGVGWVTIEILVKT